MCRWFLAGVFVASCLAACTGSDLPQTDCSGTIPTYSQVSLINTCVGCHSSQLTGGARAGAPASVNYDTYAAAVDNATNGAAAVDSGRMPIGAAPSAQQRDDFIQWALCGTPQ
jgi:mono/diheme cytochrome c family protein